MLRPSGDGKVNLRHVLICPSCLLSSSLFCLLADNYVVAWKRGIAIISAGTVKVTPDERIKLVDGYSLEIKDAVPQDAGDYVCQIATMEPLEITHTVEILGKKFTEINYTQRYRVSLSSSHSSSYG